MLDCYEAQIRLCESGKPIWKVLPQYVALLAKGADSRFLVSCRSAVVSAVSQRLDEVGDDLGAVVLGSRMLAASGLAVAAGSGQNMASPPAAATRSAAPRKRRRPTIEIMAAEASGAEDSPRRTARQRGLRLEGFEPPTPRSGTWWSRNWGPSNSRERKVIPFPKHKLVLDFRSAAG